MAYRFVLGFKRAALLSAAIISLGGLVAQTGARPVAASTPFPLSPLPIAEAAPPPVTAPLAVTAPAPGTTPTAVSTPADLSVPAAAASPIPLKELGQHADALQPAPAPVLAAGQARLDAPLHALRGEITAAGLVVASTSQSEGGGRLRLTPTQLDKGGAPLALPPGRLSQWERALLLDRGALTEVLTASGDGLRQDFVVAQPPPGDGPLTLSLALEGATASPAPAGVTLTLPGGRQLLYHGLHITDATGQVLAGELGVRDERSLTITVADAGARYPLTLDPTISDADWQALATEMNGAVKALAYDPTNKILYAGGEFTTAGGDDNANYIAQWNGSAWSALGTGMDNIVSALAVAGDGTLYAGGLFTTAAGNTAKYIAKWYDSAWSALGAMNGTVSALAVAGDGTLYAGGAFTLDGEITVKRIAKWSGTAWSALGDGMDDGAVSALAVASDGTLYAGGTFTKTGGTTVNRIAKWNGTAWSALGSGMNNTVSALAVAGDGPLYAGGPFDTAGGTTVNRIAQWNGTAWSALGSGMNYAVRTLAVAGDGTLFAGGEFTKADGNGASHIAQWNGTAWSALGSGTDGSLVQALAVSGTTLYVGGTFTKAGGKDSVNAAYANLSPCGSGLAYTTATWQMLALPCVPSGETVAGTFGSESSNSLTKLTNANYGSQWAFFWRRYPDTPIYARLDLAEAFTPGRGYWFLSKQAPTGANLDLKGTATVVTPGGGCVSANGCVAIAVSETIGKYNLVGNPFPYDIDWKDVRVRVSATGVPIYTYTPSEAAGIGELGKAANPAVLAKTFWSWNGNTYVTADDTSAAESRRLPYFTAFWVQVLDGAEGKTVELLFPAQPFGTAQAGAAGLEGLAARAKPAWYLAWLDWLIPAAAAEGAIEPGRAPEDRPARGWARHPAQQPPPAVTDPEFDLLVTQGIWSHGLSPAEAEREAHAKARDEGREWYVQLAVDEPATGFKDRYNYLGQMLTAADGYDTHDLIEMPPFTKPNLTLVFPRPAWGDRAGDYATDFRAASATGPGRRPQQLDWVFEVRAEERPGAQVVLHWQGPPEVLNRSVLIDQANRETIRPDDPRYAQGFPVTLGQDGKSVFTWQVKKLPLR